MNQANPPLMPLATSIVTHTPHGVWLVLACLVVLGARQLRPHRIGRVRALLLPLAMAGLSLMSTASVFGPGIAVWCAWFAAGTASFFIGRRFEWPRPIGYDSARDAFEMPGSAWPMMLMLGIFALRYAVGVTLAFHADWARSAAFALPVSALYGGLTALFSVRAFNLLQVARAPGRLQLR